MRRTLGVALVGLGGLAGACFRPSHADSGTNGGSSGTGGPTGTSAGTAPTSGPGTGGTGCAAGAAGCSCGAGDACDGSLTCVAGMCTDCGNGTVESPEQCDGPVSGGTCQACLVVCDDSHGDCDADPSTCETPLNTSAANCGSCGHGCGEGACSGGLCQPVVLASNLGQPLGIDVADGYVYWVDQATGGNDTGRILRHPVMTGGDPEVLVDGLGNPERLVVASPLVYWGNVVAGGVEQVGIDGTGRVTLVANEPAPKRFAMHGNDLLWVVFTAMGAVRNLPAGQANAVTVASGQPFAVGLAVDGDYVYWTTHDEGAIRRLDLSNANAMPEDLTTGQSGPFSVVVQDGTMYWANEGTQAAGFVDGEIRSLPVGGGDEVVLASAERRPRELVIDGQTLYWVDRVSSGSVKRLDLGTMTTVEIVSGAGLPGGIAIDATSIYWTEQQTGIVAKLAK